MLSLNSSERDIKELKDKFLRGKCPNLVIFKFADSMYYKYIVKAETEVLCACNELARCMGE